MNTHTTLSGRAIEYPDPTPAEAAFLARVRAAVDDPTVSSNDLLALIYGPENPVLDHDFLPGRAWVTPRVLDNPLYRVLADLHGVKEVRLGLLDVEKAHATYTVPVPDAARQLGVTQQAVRAAIDGWRLAAVFRGGQWWLRPESLASFQVSKAGRPRKTPAGVSARVGGAKGASLSVRIEGGELAAEGKEDGATVGRFPAGWTRAVVKTTSDKGTRAFEIEPAPGESGAIEHAGLYVRGPFKVAKKHNATAAANAAWRAAGKAAAR